MTQEHESLGWIWETHLKLWNQLGPPLRPSWEDLRIMQEEISSWSKANADSPAQALVFGVTPEFPALNWPQGSRVYALDRSLQMINLIWYASAQYAAGAVASTWEALPIRDNSIDLILGDGCLTLVAWQDGYRKVFESMRSVLRPGGRVLMRSFVQPGPAENVDTVFNDLSAGKIGSFNAFKWRLVMALHGNNPMGVRLGDVWDAWQARAVDVESLAWKTGWLESSIRTIETYRDMDIRYSFPGEQEFRALCGEYFTELASHTPVSEISANIRLLVLERAANG